MEVGFLAVERKGRTDDWAGLEPGPKNGNCDAAWMWKVRQEKWKLSNRGSGNLKRLKEKADCCCVCLRVYLPQPVPYLSNCSVIARFGFPSAPVEEVSRSSSVQLDNLAWNGLGRLRSD